MATAVAARSDGQKGSNEDLVKEGKKEHGDGGSLGDRRRSDLNGARGDGSSRERRCG